MKLAMMAAIIIFDLVPHPSLKLHREFCVSLISSLFIQQIKRLKLISILLSKIQMKT